MKAWPWLASLRLFSKSRMQREMDEELLFHLDCQMSNYVRKGIPPQEARRLAIIDFGGLPQIQEDCREARGFPAFDELLQNLRYAARQLSQNPGFAFLSVLVLALGIGANTAVLSVVDLLIYRPLPVHEPEKLVRNEDLVSYPNYLDLKKEAKPIAGIACASWWALDVWDSQHSESLSGRAVSADFFHVLGINMALGRTFLPAEDQYPGKERVTIISNRLWLRRFGGNPAVLGQTIRLNGELFTIVGVAPRGFRDVNYNGAYRDIWIPLPMFRAVQHLEKDPIWSDVFEQRGKPFLMLIGRLNPGVRLDQAQTRLALIAGRLKKSYPESAKYLGSNREWKISATPMGGLRIPGKETRFVLNLLLAAAGCIFMICCANVGSLFLARASARQREIATRYAIGASRFRVIRQLMTECLLISGIALAASFAVWKMVLLCFPALEGSLNEGAIGTMGDLDLNLDPRIFLIGAAIALIANILFSIFPVVLGSQTGIAGILKDHRMRGNTSPRVRRVLVIAQVILSSVLLVGAGLFIRFITRFYSAEPGFNTNVVVVRPGKPFYEIDFAKSMNYYRAAHERIRSLPGVRSAAWSYQVPPENGVPDNVRPEPASADTTVPAAFSCSISPGYFRTLGIPILQGRDFDDAEITTRPNVAIVNETTARAFWPGTSAIGKRIRINEIYEVIGVARNAGYTNVWNGSRPVIYLPISQIGVEMPQLHVSVFGTPASMIVPIRRAFDAFGPEARVRQIGTMSDEMKLLLSRERATAFVLTLFGSLALLLATVGLYGVVAYSVAQRRREFGIRLALGAQHSSIRNLVLLEGVGTVAAGLIVGLPLSMAVSGFIASRLHTMNPMDPISYAAITILWLAVSVSAVLSPAQRAVSKSMGSLREE